LVADRLLKDEVFIKEATIKVLESKALEDILKSHLDHAYSDLSKVSRKIKLRSQSVVSARAHEKSEEEGP
jgi:hypothetical protein